MIYLKGKLPLEVWSPVHGVLDEWWNEEGVDDAFEQTDLSHPPVVEDRVLPVGQTLHQNPVVNLTLLGVAQNVVDTSKPPEFDLKPKFGMQFQTYIV